MRYLALALIAGCTSTSAVDLVLVDPPALVSYRTASSAWQTPPVSAHGPDGTHYRLRGDADLEILVVCLQSDGTFLSQELFAAREDLAHSLTTWPQNACAGAVAGATLSVDGQMVQTGTVSMNGSPQGQAGSGPWSYHFSVPSGPNDLAAISADNSRVLIRHNQSIESAFTEPMIDLASEGVPTDVVTFSIPDLQAGETTASSIYMNTKNGARVLIRGSGQSANAFPTQTLDSGDEQALFVTLVAGPTSHEFVRSAWLNITSTSVEVDMMPRLDGVTYSSGDVAGSWTTLPAGIDSVRVDYLDASGEQSVTATSHWISRNAAQQVQFDAAAPGYDPSWSVNAATASRLFAAETVTNGDVYTTIDSVGAAVAPVAPRSVPRGREQRALR